MPDFKKGDAVFLISDWDRKGTVRIIEARVYSCGKKQMILTSATTGKELGRHFWPQAELEFSRKRGTGFAIKGTDRTEAEAMALKFAADVLAAEQARHGEGYDRLIRKEREMLHDPSFLWRDE